MPCTPYKYSRLCKIVKRQRLKIILKAVVKSQVLPSAEVQEEVAQLIDLQHSRSAQGPDSIVADTNQSGDTTATVELNEVFSEEAATEYRTAAAITFKNRAVEYMAVNNNVELKAFVEELGNWRPCAASLRKSGLSLIFQDIMVWEEATVAEEAYALRAKFSRLVKQGRRKGSTELVTPFSEVSSRQFRQTSQFHRRWRV